MDSKRLHSSFEEIEALYLSRNPPRIRSAADQIVPDNEVAEMSNMTETAELERDLFRAKQISELGNFDKSIFKGNPGSQTIITNKSSAITLISGPQNVLHYGNGAPLVVGQVNVDEDAETISVMLTGPGDVYHDGYTNPSNGVLQLVGIIEFGAGGVQAVAEVDWVNGQVIQVPGTFLRLLTRLDDLSTAAPDGNGQVNVGCYFSRKLKSRQSPLTRTFRIAQPLTHGAVSGRIVIPAFATQVQLLYTTDQAPSDTRIDMSVQGVVDNVIGTVEWEKPAGNGQIVQLAGPVSSIQVVNNDGAASALIVWVVFTIEL